ncbi:MAG: DUF1998 domain-containing protein [Gammaproteobacteria bacterium]|nr:DUF1998 domain-containing protein [Gammaproteobacteria bacterium]
MTYCTADDSHDQRFFSDPQGMVSGLIVDPILNLDNEEIIQRHCFALLMSLYQQEVIPDPGPEDAAQSANVFESLGKLRDFRDGGEGDFSYAGLERWIQQNRTEITRVFEDFLDADLQIGDKADFIRRLPDNLLSKLKEAGAGLMDEAMLKKDLSPSQQAISAEDQQPVRLQLVFEDDDEYGFDAQSAQPGEDTGKIEQETSVADSNPDAPGDSEKLLDRLFDKGVLPRYAFPTDVVTFHVFNKDKSTPRRAALEYTPQQGLNLALSAYAPGREVWVDGLRHWSMALWTPFNSDRIRAYRRQELYYECDVCGYAVLKKRDSKGEHHIGQTLTCDACGEAAGLGPAIRWFSPPGFAHPVDMKQDIPMQDIPQATRPTRAKLSAPFNDKAHDRDMALTSAGSGFFIWSGKEYLIMTNKGVENSHKPGFNYCPLCGRAEPNDWAMGQLRGRHAKPFPHGGGCDGRPVEVVFGSRFRTDIALFRFRLAPPLVLPPGSTVARLVLTTLAQAMSMAAIKLLDIDPGDISGEHRVAMNDAGKAGKEVEVYIYDLASGGAGFVQAAVEDSKNLLEITLELLEKCTCTHSCYECLRNYQNKWDHHNLDRCLAAAFLRHCLYGELPVIPPETEKRLLNTLATDLRDHGCQVIMETDYLLLPEYNGRRVKLSHALVPAASECIDQLRVERALPAAVMELIGDRAQQYHDTKPVSGPELTQADEGEGVPVYAFDDLMNGWEQLPEPQQRVNAADPPDSAFVVKLTEQTMEKQSFGNGLRLLNKGQWVMFAKTAPDDYNRKSVQVLLRKQSVFKATGKRWTVGRPAKFVIDGEASRVHIIYHSDRKQCKNEAVLADETVSMGRLAMIYHNGQWLSV